MLARRGFVAGTILMSSSCLALVSTSDLSGGGSPDATIDAPAADDAPAIESDAGVIDPVDAADTPAEAGVWPVNGHRYAIWTFENPKRWDQARDEAILAGVHLVTITSEAEQQFVVALVNTRPELLEEGYGPWIGAYQPAPTSTDEPAGGWAWITTEPWSYTRWRSREPNNFGNVEHYGHLTELGEWNDTTIEGANRITSAIVEFE